MWTVGMAFLVSMIFEMVMSSTGLFENKKEPVAGVENIEKYGSDFAETRDIIDASGYKRYVEDAEEIAFTKEREEREKS